MSKKERTVPVASDYVPKRFGLKFGSPPVIGSSPSVITR